jgi:hypothetical protein
MLAQQLLRSQTDSIIGNTPDTPKELMYCGVINNGNKYTRVTYAVIFYVPQLQRRDHFFHHQSQQF